MQDEAGHCRVAVGLQLRDEENPGRPVALQGLSVAAEEMTRQNAAKRNSIQARAIVLSSSTKNNPSTTHSASTPISTGKPGLVRESLNFCSQENPIEQPTHYAEAITSTIKR